jgi:hypothetical protein
MKQDLQASNKRKVEQVMGGVICMLKLKDFVGADANSSK